jgi:hypothetical protein
MSDIVNYATSGNTYRNGRCIVGVTQLGNYKALDPKVNMSTVTSQSGVLNNRFDNYTFYAGSGVGG